MFPKKHLGILNVSHITLYDNHIIHIDSKNNTPIHNGLAKDGRFHFTCREITLPNEGAEFNESSSRALFEAIDGFAKTIHLDKFPLDHVARRLIHIDLIIEIVIEKGIGEI